VATTSDSRLLYVGGNAAYLPTSTKIGVRFLMYRLPSAIQRLEMPESVAYIGKTVRAAERELERGPAPSAPLDATYANTHRFPPPPYALKAFTEAASGAGMTYTPYVGDRTVRKTVSENIETYLGFSATGSSSTILTPGTQAALFVALSAIIEPGDLVILPDPDYLSTERALRYFGAEVAHVPVHYEGDGRPTIDAEILTALAKRKPKLFIFSHPNNPTGAVYGDETLELIASLAQEHDFYVLADQLYGRLVYDNKSFVNIANLDGMAARTVTTTGPSKTESLSGYRLGVAVAPNELIERMEDVQSITALRAPAYAQHVLTHWLAEDGQYVADRIVEYQAIRDSTVEKLNASGVASVRPSWGTSYLFPRILVDASDQQIALALKKDAGVIVNPGYQFGPAGVGHVRLCIAQDETEWSQALDRVIDVLKSLQG
jgi:aspartate/methionine/tyrosine aminotransferase